MVELVVPNAESAMESRLRILLIEAGLPAPEVQVNLYSANGEFLARADLFYKDAGLVIEYDGGTHKHSVAEDNRRQNGLVNAGYTPLRFHLIGRPRKPTWRRRPGPGGTGAAGSLTSERRRWN